MTVRVEGLSETKLPPTLATLTGAPVVKDGNSEHSCSGGSALGALDVATAGNWEGLWESSFGQYSIQSIEGELHKFESESTANYFWSFWLNDKEAEVGACEATLNPGDRVLFFPSCFGSTCPQPAPLPLDVEGPATASVGEPVKFEVRRYSSNGSSTPAAGASVVGGGSGGLTESAGAATLTFAHAGEKTLVQVDAPDSIRTEAYVCVHNGEDGTCNTTKASNPPSIGPTGRTSAPLVTPATALTVGLLGGHFYSRRNAPRLLRGVVHPGTETVKDVRISLQRQIGKRCLTFSGLRGRFVRARCGRTSFFSVGDSLSFSYLLPSRLGAGRYSFSVEAITAGGPARASHVTFRVL